MRGHPHEEDLIVRFGIPEEVKSDNGPQYASKEFQLFSKDWKFNHITSSPRYPRSNGLAERTVQTAKHLLEKVCRSRQDPYLAILESRNTPVDGFASPAQLLMSRNLRSTIPSLSQLQPKVIDTESLRQQRELVQQRQKYYHDQSSHSLTQLEKGESVRIKQENKWKPAVVIEKDSTPRSYMVQTPEGKKYRRNRSHLLKTKEQSFPEREEEEMELNHRVISEKQN